jgi:hypothetical protein
MAPAAALPTARPSVEIPTQTGAHQNAVGLPECPPPLHADKIRYVNLPTSPTTVARSQAGACLVSDGSKGERRRKPPVVVVTLREITDENRAAVLALRVTAQQEQFVGSVHDALQDALEYPDAKPWYRAIYADDEPVGFLHSPTPKQLS